jgi:hypothetical protein
MSPSARPFDPYRILHQLDQSRVWYILVGGLARVLQGSDEVTVGVDLTPSTREGNIERLAEALMRLDALPTNGARLARSAAEPQRDPVVAFDSPSGEIKVVTEPAGTRGFDDLRHKGNWLHIGEGLRTQVASPGDLVRMLEALERPGRENNLEAMRRVVELDRGRGLEL